MATATDRFFEKEYEGRRLAAVISADGPYILDIDGHEGVALGASSNAYCKKGGVFGASKEGWWVTKYRNQPRINLVSLSKSAREELAADFGLQILSEKFEKDSNRFGSSAAFQGLCEWAMKHPRLYKRSQQFQEYLPWVAMVEEQKTKAA